MEVLNFLGTALKFFCYPRCEGKPEKPSNTGYSFFKKKIDIVRCEF
jgi:hypothetical protein